MASEANNGYWGKSRRLSRRRLLATTAAGGLGVASAVLIACGDDDDQPSGGASAPGGQPKRGGVFTTPSQPSGLSPGPGSGSAPGGPNYHDPHSTPFTPTLFMRPVSNYIVTMNQADANPDNWKVTADLANKWETPDATTYIFHLDPAAKFHNLPPVNGRAVTAEDVRYTIERIKTASFPNFARQADYADVTVEVVDPKTVRMRLKAPSASFWTRITTAGTVVLSKEVVDGEGGFIKGNGPVAGTGAFIHDEYTEWGSSRVKRNPDYWKPGRPYLDEYRTRYFTDAEARFVALRAGQIDTMEALTPEQYQEGKTLPGVNASSRDGTVPRWLFFNTRKAPFSDPRVRYAISLAMPRQEMVNIVYRGEDFAAMSAPGGLIPGLHGSATYSAADLKKRPGYRSGAEATQDLEEAKKLLAAAGFTGYTGPLVNGSAGSASAETAISEIALENLKKIGVNVTLRLTPYAQFLSTVQANDWEIGMNGQGAIGFDADGLLDTYFGPAGGRNYTKWTHAEFEKLLREEQQQIDSKQRNATIRKMGDILEKEGPRFALVLPKFLFAKREKVQGLWTPVGAWGYDSFPLEDTWINA